MGKPLKSGRAKNPVSAQFPRATFLSSIRILKYLGAWKRINLCLAFFLNCRTRDVLALRRVHDSIQLYYRGHKTPEMVLRPFQPVKLKFRGPVIKTALDACSSQYVVFQRFTCHQWFRYKVISPQKLVSLLHSTN